MSSAPYASPAKAELKLPELASPALGRPRKIMEQTFALNEGDIRHVRALVGFRRIFTAMCVHIPYVKEGDLVMMREPRFVMVGEARVLDVKQVEVRSGMRTVLALQMIEDDVDEHQGNSQGEVADE